MGHREAREFDTTVRYCFGKQILGIQKLVQLDFPLTPIKKPHRTQWPSLSVSRK
jgi:hypothetical protein